MTVEIRDNGRGIPNDKIEEVFRPFQRLASDVEGSGIGLACVKKLVERLGGQISAESVLDRGSVFRVTLPRTDATHTSHSTLKLESRI